jgi:hypothetical protein
MHNGHRCGQGRNNRTGYRFEVYPVHIPAFFSGIFFSRREKGVS